MAEIRIEGSDAFGLGGHLYLVYVDDLGNEFVIRGGPENDVWDFPDLGEIVVERGIAIAQSEDVRPIADRDEYGSSVLDLAGRNASDVWKTMVAMAELIDEDSLAYDWRYENSNSVVAAVLHAVGIDVENVLPFSPSAGFYLGYGNQLSDEFERHFAVQQSSPNADWLRGGDLADVIASGAGDDLIEGGDGGDDIDGGDGFDTLYFTPSNAGVSIDIEAGTGDGGHATGDMFAGIEAFVGSAYADTFASRTDLTVHPAGGDGNDTFYLGSDVDWETGFDRSGVMVCWGGAGADVFRMEDEGLVLLLEVSDLTLGRFHALTTDMLSGLIDGVASDYDMIILNPDAEDRLFVGNREVSLGPSEEVLPGPFMTEWLQVGGEEIPVVLEGNNFTRDTFVFSDEVEAGGYTGYRVTADQIELASGATVTARRATEAWYTHEYYELWYRDAEGELHVAGSNPGEPNDWLSLIDPDFIYAKSDVIAAEDMDEPFRVNDSDAIRFYHVVAPEAVDYWDGQFALVGAMEGAELEATIAVSAGLGSVPDDFYRFLV